MLFSVNESIFLPDVELASAQKLVGNYRYLEEWASQEKLRSDSEW